MSRTALDIEEVGEADPKYAMGGRFQCRVDGTVFAARTVTGLRELVRRVMKNRELGWAKDADWKKRSKRAFEEREARAEELE